MGHGRVVEGAGLGFALPHILQVSVSPGFTNVQVLQFQEDDITLYLALYDMMVLGYVGTGRGACSQNFLF